MDAGAADLLWFVTACAPSLGERVSSVSRGQHRLARIEGVRTSTPSVPERRCALAPTTITSADP
jgi:hypothetical protein